MAKMNKTSNTNENQLTKEQLNDDADDDDQDQSWVLDSLVGFLKSPLWSSSVNNFIDKMSIVFEPDNIEDNDGNVEHRNEYKSIFKQYRSLVDQLITSHMMEMGISEEQFALACELAEGMLANKLKRILFEELWAAESYEVFVRLMAKRNVELQLEALEVLAQRYGLVYDVFVPTGTSPKNFLSEEHVMREAILRSLNDLEVDDSDDGSMSDVKVEKVTNEEEPQKEQESQAEIGKEETNDTNEEQKLDQTIEEGDKNAVQRDKVRLEEVKQIANKKMTEALETAIKNPEDDNVNSETVTMGDNTLENIEHDTDKREVQTPESTWKSTGEGNSRQGSPFDSAEISKRANYLRQQRDKIIQMRQKERSERISKYLTKEKNKESNSDESDGSSSSNSQRPKTGKRITKEQLANVESSVTNQAEINELKNKELAYRKTLAARLKAEVILDH